MSAKNTREETKVKLYDLKVNYQKNPWEFQRKTGMENGWR